jgi:predicted Zn-ribbon and HTH transcriptional regulator
MKTLHKGARKRIQTAARAAKKLEAPALCGDCGAVYRAGRWRWQPAPALARAARCPACKRIRERAPGATVTLGGEFLAAHRDEILGRVRNCEQAERATHPMQRIMAIKAHGGGMRITTTDAHLARRIGDALRRSFKGELSYRYDGDEDLRVTWRR